MLQPPIKVETVQNPGGVLDPSITWGMQVIDERVPKERREYIVTKRTDGVFCPTSVAGLIKRAEYYIRANGDS